MLHSLDYSDSANIRDQFFRAKLVDGDGMPGRGGVYMIPKHSPPIMNSS